MEVTNLSSRNLWKRKSEKRSEKKKGREGRKERRKNPYCKKKNGYKQGNCINQAQVLLQESTKSNRVIRAIFGLIRKTRSQASNLSIQFSILYSTFSSKIRPRGFEKLAYRARKVPGSYVIAGKTRRQSEPCCFINL